MSALTGDGHEAGGRAVRLGQRLVRLALHAFPRRFRDRLGDDLIAAFVDRAEARTIVRGAPAQRGATRSIGSVAAILGVAWITLRTVSNVVREGLRERWQWRGRRPVEPDRKMKASMPEPFRSDLRLAVRRTIERPAFTLFAVLTLGLGVGANTAIFSVVDGVLLRALPYPESERLVSVWTTHAGRGRSRGGASLHDYEDWRVGTDVFAALAVYNANTANLGGIDRPERIGLARVSPDFFAVLGVQPAIGRIFREEENLPGASDVVILSHGFWRDRLASEPGVTGRTVTLDGRPHTIVGVMPVGFGFPLGTTQAWVPFGMRADDGGSRGGRWVTAIARLRADQRPANVQSALDDLAQRLADSYPETNEGIGILVEPMLASVTRAVRTPLYVLWGAVGLVLLIAGANLAGLLLTRAVDRSREFSLRAALGASRTRLIAQVLAESIPFSLLGGVAGAALAYGGVRLLTALSASSVPRIEEIGVDTVVLLYSMAVALLVGLGFSLLPALSVTRHDPAAALRDGTRATVGHQRIGARDAIVAGQIGLAVVVLIGASLLLRTFVAVLDTSPGFEADNLVALRIAPSWTEMPERTRAADFFDAVLEEAERTPGVVRAAAVNRLPLAGSWWATSVLKEGAVPDPADRGPIVYTRVITPGYFETIGLPVLRGRAPLESDREDDRFIVAINRTMAETLWPGEDPIGARITMGGPVWYTVAGIVGDERYNSLSQPTAPVMYIGLRQGTFGHFQDWGMSIVVRTAGDPLGIIEELRDRVQRAAGPIPVFDVVTFDARITDDVAAQRFNATLFALFALLALALAAIGVYGLFAFTVARRTREFGVRIALGAARRTIIAMVLQRGLALAGAGIAIGGLVGALLTRLLANMLFGVAPRDPLAFASASLVLVLVAALACGVPAWRASRVPAATALRHD